MNEIKVTMVENPALPSTFVDFPAVAGQARDGIMHVELAAIRPDAPTAGKEADQTAKAFPVVRLAMTIPAALALKAFLAHHLTELEKQGLVKRTAPLPTEAKH